MSLAGVIRRLRPAKGFEDGWREFVTPEGVDLRLRVGTYTDRGLAFALDMAIIMGALVALTLAVFALGAFAGSLAKAQWPATVVIVSWLLGGFALRYFYFVYFEMRPGAATPGKRALGLRVAARDGGRLTADAVFARNAMRELEIFLPLAFLGARGEGVDAGLIGLGAIWSGVFLVFPLFNRDRLRLGDLAAGTMVIKTPKRRIAPDLAPQGQMEAVGLVFTPAQLDAYGEKELHVLEEVLRKGDRKTMAEVAKRIQAKIGWQGPADGSNRSFLAAYYGGLRGRLEQRLLFGRRRKDKFDRS
jgi:uncharacterized RDD family membrane protein YckC